MATTFGALGTCWTVHTFRFPTGLDAATESSALLTRQQSYTHTRTHMLRAIIMHGVTKDATLATLMYSGGIVPLGLHARTLIDDHNLCDSVRGVRTHSYARSIIMTMWML